MFRTVGYRATPTETGHAALLAPHIRDTMREANLPYSALDRIAVTVGPGSFTGLRIAISAARGLALAAGKRLVGVTAFAAVAEALATPVPTPLLVALDSRRSDLFVQVFVPGSWASEPACVAPVALPAWLVAHGIVTGQELWIVGDAGPQALAAATAYSARLCFGSTFIDARVVARVAADLDPEAESSSAGPLYLRPADAVPSPTLTPFTAPAAELPFAAHPTLGAER